MSEHKTIEGSLWTYRHTSYEHTHIYDEEGELVMALPFKADAAVVVGACHGMKEGLRRGEELGAARKLSEIQRVLGIQRRDEG